MRRRQLIVLHLGLALVAGGLAWRLAADWNRANLRYRVLSKASEPGAAGNPFSVAGYEPLATQEIVEMNLFSPDRNNEGLQVEAGPRPPVPIVFGTMKLGESYEALMAERGSGGELGFQRVKTGQQMGSYKVLEIEDAQVVVEFQGQKTTIDVYQSARSVAPAPARPAAAAAPVVESASAPAAAPSGPARSSPTATAAPQPPGATGDVRVTIEGNRRKFERNTPFGVQTWYEPMP